MATTKQRIIDAAKKHPGITARDVSDLTGVGYHHVASVLSDARRAGILPRVINPGGKRSTGQFRARSPQEQDQEAQEASQDVWTSEAVKEEGLGLGPEETAQVLPEAIWNAAVVVDQLRAMRNDAISRAKRYEAALFALGVAS